MRPHVNRRLFLQATSAAALLPLLGAGSMVLAQDATSIGFVLNPTSAALTRPTRSAWLMG